jgi:ABC-type multidrug transport system permease subunit
MIASFNAERLKMRKRWANWILVGVLLVILVLLLFASTAMYMLERGAQPDKFGSIPAAAW